MTLPDVIGLAGGFLLTLFIYSYLLGDNALYRIAVHIMVGVTAGYAAVVAVLEVFVPLFQQLLADPTAPANVLWLIPLILALLLLLIWVRPVAWLANGAVGALVGVGAAVGLVGVITGTLLPQILNEPAGDPVLGLVAALFTVCALLYFQFTGPATTEGDLVQPGWRRMVNGVGQAVLMVTFGALFAGAINTGLILFIDRVVTYLNGFLEALNAF